MDPVNRLGAEWEKRRALAIVGGERLEECSSPESKLMLALLAVTGYLTRDSRFQTRLPTYPRNLWGGTGIRLILAEVWR